MMIMEMMISGSKHPGYNIRESLITVEPPEQAWQNSKGLLKVQKELTLRCKEVKKGKVSKGCRI